MRVLGSAEQLDGESGLVDVVIDTGFTGQLVLPPEAVGRLGLPGSGRRRAILADGRTVEVNVYLARVIWHGRERAVQVLATEGGPLVGMALLGGSWLTVDAAPDGFVLVEELP
jgi:clan AA aspartic protease